MRKFSVRWWTVVTDPHWEYGEHMHFEGNLRNGFCPECLLGVPTIPLAALGAVPRETVNVYC